MSDISSGEETEEADEAEIGMRTDEEEDPAAILTRGAYKSGAGGLADLAHVGNVPHRTFKGTS